MSSVKKDNTMAERSWKSIGTLKTGKKVLRSATRLVETGALHILLRSSFVKYLMQG